MKLGAIVVSAAFGLVGVQAGATTLDFESLTAGTLITTQLESQGVLVSRTGTIHCCGLGPGLVLDVANGDWGVTNFGGSGRKALLYGVVGDQLNFDFVLPNTTSATTWQSVSLRVGDGDPYTETFKVTFKDLNGNSLFSSNYTTGSGSTFGGVTVSYQSNVGIHRVEIFGVGATGGGVDDLTFTSPAAPVPEPETYAMMLAGLGLLGVVARRRKQKSAA